MDYRTGQILDAIKQAGIEDNTLVIFTSDNGPEATHPWEGDGGPWRGTYFTAMEAISAKQSAQSPLPVLPANSGFGSVGMCISEKET
jgi:hypothetical protein